MSKPGRQRKHRYAAGAAALAALALALGVQGAQAGTLAQVQAGASRAQARPTSAMEFCVGVARGPNCRSAFETALRGASQASAARGRLYSAMAAPQAAVSNFSNAPAELAALKFNSDPEWKRRAKVMAHDGLPFVRMPQGGNRELIVGITPHGRLGFSLKEKSRD